MKKLLSILTILLFSFSISADDCPTDDCERNEGNECKTGSSVSSDPNDISSGTATQNE